MRTIWDAMMVSGAEPRFGADMTNNRFPQGNDKLGTELSLMLSVSRCLGADFYLSCVSVSPRSAFILHASFPSLMCERSAL